MKPYRLEIKIEGLPPMTNRNRVHWAKLMRQTKLWKHLVYCAVGANRPPQPLAKAKIILTRVSSVRPDFDGLASGFKPCVDGLKLAGVIIDDNPYVIGQPEYRYEKGKPGRGYIKIVVEEIIMSWPMAA